ncbi:Hypothetical predicted protein [Podarcis lilfordi]|uniref:Uncharacterized protein n=1 Tax=Podarcis lilfordi TaxID=74358 RepID=A0AA35KL29_9SAUR|nr:Hypothetical predicted protein [Podarcis lilfordi]
MIDGGGHFFPLPPPRSLSPGISRCLSRGPLTRAGVPGKGAEAPASERGRWKKTSNDCGLSFNATLFIGLCWTTHHHEYADLCSDWSPGTLCVPDLYF